ncbi:hypothetical protein BGW80DRAFT_1263871 [Lactifluus volemus]|nr:hypothetical protein BGW80DRAFT_1263871 [Lactifluus volemus]
MTDISLYDLLDLEAIVADEDEEDEEYEEELDDFLADDLEESVADPSERPVFLPDDRISATEASELEARINDFAKDSGHAHRYEVDVVPQHLLVPTDSDPGIWAVRVKLGFESSLVLQLFRRCTRLERLDVTSIFARDGIPGYVFLEGSLPAVGRALSGLVTVLAHHSPRLVPIEERTALLSSRNTLACSIQEGQWVRINYGLYRGDIGFVCGSRDSSDLDIVVALVPRIPVKTDLRSAGHIGKRKRSFRPPPRMWSEAQVIHEWGAAKVRNISSDTFIFRNETYESGLLMTSYSSTSLLVVSSPSPSTFLIFLAASSVSERPSFGQCRHHFAQDSLQPEQRVKVESGDLIGLIGHINEIVDGVASIIPEKQVDFQVMPLIPLRKLAPHYIPGDNVKARCGDSYGIVESVNDADQTLVYVRSNPIQEDLVEFYDPPLQRSQQRVGTWVEFHADSDGGQGKRRGFIKQMDGGTARVVDEHTFREFMINEQQLNVCAIQGPSLPRNDPTHPFVGRRVVITRGAFKSYHGLIKDVGPSGVIVEPQALLVATSSPRQLVSWCDFIAVPATEPARPPSPPRPITPPSGVPVDFERLTPEPEGSQRGRSLNIVILSPSQ